MKRQELEESINVCREIILLLDNPESKYVNGTLPENVKSVPESKIAAVNRAVLRHTKLLFNREMRRCKPLLNGDMRKIGRMLDVHYNTFLNYCNGSPSDPVVMLPMIKLIQLAHAEKKKRLLQES